MRWKRAGRKARVGIRPILAMMFVLFLSFQSGLPLCFGKGPQGFSSVVKTPQELEKWFSSNLRYQMKFPDTPQTPQEMLHSGAGDCDDFARLASAALAGMGISSDIVVVKIKGLRIRHAICLWKNADGVFSFFSNQQLISTGETNMEAAIKRYFPSCETITIMPSETHP